MPAPVSGFHAPFDARALARMDLNGDGFADLALASRNQAMSAFESTLGKSEERITPLRTRWKGKRGNPTAIGARVEVWSEGRILDVHELSASSGSQGQSSTTLYLPWRNGRGPGELRVRWPDGTRTTHAITAGTQDLELRHP